jgi:phasin family protein
MQNPATSMMESYQQQMDASRHIAEAVFNGTDQIEHLMIETTRKAFDEQMKFYKALAAVRDPQGVAALQSAFFSHTPEQMTAAQQELMKIVTDAQQQIANTMIRYKAGLSVGPPSAMSDVNTVFNQPYNSGPASNALASVYSMWDKAFKESLSLANRTMVAALKPKNGLANGVTLPAASASTSVRKGKRK